MTVFGCLEHAFMAPNFGSVLLQEVNDCKVAAFYL